MDSRRELSYCVITNNQSNNHDVETRPRPDSESVMSTKNEGNKSLS